MSSYFKVLLMSAIGLMAAAVFSEPLQKQGPVVRQENGVRKIVLLPPGPGNPRNSEGDFIQLRDGRLLFIYTHFMDHADRGGDHGPAYLAGRFSQDGGRTWTEEDVLVIPNEGDWNVMSVSLLRLHSGEIALFYLQKNSREDCRPVIRISTDEARTWSRTVQIIPDDQIGYYILNNDRVVQLRSGRLVAPVARHHGLGWKEWTRYGHITAYLSDDRGRTWRRSRTVLTPSSHPQDTPVMMQEPGVVELKDGRLMMFIRTDQNAQYLSYSSDQGESWSEPVPGPMRSPLSPATIERIPKTGDLLLVWNDNAHTGTPGAGKRSPFNVAISKDEGRSWEKIKVLEDDPDGWYCYTAVDFIGDRILLGHCAGNRPQGTGLKITQITLFDLDWLYDRSYADRAPKPSIAGRLSRALLKNPAKPLLAQETLWAGNKYHIQQTRGGYSRHDIRKNPWVTQLSAAALIFGDMDGDSYSGFPEPWNWPTDDRISTTR